MSTEAQPLGHLTPFVVAIAKARIAKGETLDETMLAACLRQAVDEDNARCLRWSGIDTQGYEMRDAQHEAMRILSAAVYQSIRAKHPNHKAEYNPRWLACAAEKGVAPSELRNIDYITWSGHRPKQ